MLKTRRLVFWQNMASHHQIGVLRSLAQDCGFQVVLVIEEALSGDRAAMGWPEIDGEGMELVVAPTREKIDEIMAFERETSLHFIGGIFGLKMARYVFFSGVKKKLKFVFMNEAPVPKDVELLGKTGLNRRFGNYLPWAQKFVRMWAGRSVMAVLCIGAMAEEAYRAYGWGEKVFPYGYFPAGPGGEFEAKVPEGDFQITYLGQLTHRKGTDVLVRALAEVKNGGWQASFYGDGEQAAECRELVEKLEFTGKVCLNGYARWDDAMALIERSDLVVVPSRHDGWGAVVGESLMRGVPVVATDRTGSSVLLEQDWRGSVVPAGDPYTLGEAIDEWVKRGRLTQDERKRIATWGLWLEPQSAATYVLGIVSWIEGGPRPVTPWHRE